MSQPRDDDGSFQPQPQDPNQQEQPGHPPSPQEVNGSGHEAGADAEASEEELDGSEYLQVYHCEPVPREFHSFETGRPFSQCLVCGRSLLEDGVSYIIQKTISRGEVIMEFAMCDTCCEELNNEMSEESRQKIDEMLRGRLDLEERGRRLSSLPGAGLDTWLERCAVTKKRRGDCESYTIQAVCDGPDLLYFGYPLLISDEAEELIVSVLSQATKGRMDDFVGQYFGPPVGALDLDPVKPTPATPVLVG